MRRISLAYLTAKNAREAKRLCDALLDEELIACANILGSISSLYRWKGKREAVKETAFIIKTQTRHRRRVEAFVSRHHGYETPCLLWFEADGGLKAYTDWIAQETS